MSVRMKDIARELGVSVVTVSKVLRNHSDIGEETRERVLKRVKELDYRPNLAARALVTGRTYTMGLVVPDLVHPFFAEVAKGLSKALRKKGYSLLISSSEEDAELERQEIEQLLARRVDALIVASAQGTAGSFQRIEKQQTPYVLVDRRFSGLAANFVGVDDEAVGMLATEHLIEQGCTRVAHIRGQEVSTAAGRLRGYERALSAHGVAPGPGYVVAGRSGDDAAEAAGQEAMQQLLRLSPPPDGVFCYNDAIALGAMRVILDAGLRVPEDVAVIGCGNARYADLLRVPLSSIDQDCAAIGERAGKLALNLISGKGTVRHRTVLLAPIVVARASTLRPGPQGT